MFFVDIITHHSSQSLKRLRVMTMRIICTALVALAAAPASHAFAVLPVGKYATTRLSAETDRSSLESADAWLDAAVKSREEKGGFDSTSFLVGIVGDLHIDPRKMEDYEIGKDHWKPIFERGNKAHGNTALVSLGDLGESKNCDHNPANPAELFAGTTQCHELAAEFLGDFDVPYEVIGGNHDLEGIDEFATDEENLQVFMKSHGKEQAQFCREIAEKTLLVGMGSTVFRAAPYTSHEVIVDDEQIEWFEDLLKTHPADDGWKVCCSLFKKVSTQAPSGSPFIAKVHEMTIRLTSLVSLLSLPDLCVYPCTAQRVWSPRSSREPRC